MHEGNFKLGNEKQKVSKELGINYNIQKALEIVKRIYNTPAPLAVGALAIDFSCSLRARLFRN